MGFIGTRFQGGREQTEWDPLPAEFREWIQGAYSDAEAKEVERDAEGWVADMAPWLKPAFGVNDLLMLANKREAHWIKAMRGRAPGPGAKIATVQGMDLVLTTVLRIGQRVFSARFRICVNAPKPNGAPRLGGSEPRGVYIDEAGEIPEEALSGLSSNIKSDGQPVVIPSNLRDSPKFQVSAQGDPAETLEASPIDEAFRLVQDYKDFKEGEVGKLREENGRLEGDLRFMERQAGSSRRWAKRNEDTIRGMMAWNKEAKEVQSKVETALEDARSHLERSERSYEEVSRAKAHTMHSRDTWRALAIGSLGLLGLGLAVAIANHAGFLA